PHQKHQQQPRTDAKHAVDWELIRCPHNRERWNCWRNNYIGRESSLPCHARSSCCKKSVVAATNAIKTTARVNLCNIIPHYAEFSPQRIVYSTYRIMDSGLQWARACAATSLVSLAI